MANFGLNTAALLASTLALANCGSGNEAAKGGGASAGGMPSGWKATDACSILDKSAVAAILKRDVPEAHLSLVNEAGAATAATSECTYAGADGNVASLMARWSPVADNTPAAIATAKSAGAAALKAFTDKPLEDVPGLGKAAFFAPGADQLTVFLDEARMIVVTAQKVPEGATGKDVTMEMAKKAGA